MEAQAVWKAGATNCVVPPWFQAEQKSAELVGKLLLIWAKHASPAGLGFSTGLEVTLTVPAPTIAVQAEEMRV